MNISTVKKIGYWLSTGFFSLGMAFSAFMYLTQSPQLVQGFQHLGYPLYMLLILGVAKGLGAVALMFPRFPRLKEWAYAGFTFNLLGAFASHLLAGDPLGQSIAPLVFLGVLTVSYVLYHNLQNSPEHATSPVLKPLGAN